MCVWNRQRAIPYFRLVSVVGAYMPQVDLQILSM